MNHKISAILFGLFFIPAVLFSQTNMPVQAGPWWERTLGTRVLGQPYLQTQTMVVAGADGSIRSYFMSGTELWRFDPQDAVSPHIARSVEGVAYVSNRSGSFMAVNRIGYEVWRIEFGRPVSFPPVVGWDGRVFIPLGSEVYTRTASGQPLWSKDLGNPMVVAPILDSVGSMVTVLENQDFVRLNQFSTEDRIRLNDLPFLTVPIMSGGHPSYVLFYTNGMAEKIVFNEGAARGNRLSRTSFPSLEQMPVAAAGRGSTVAVTLQDGRMQLLDDTGHILWTGNSHETAIERGPGFSGAVVLQTTQVAMEFDARGIYLLSTRGATGFDVDGRRRFTFKMDEAAAVPALSEEGMLYVSGSDNALRAYRVDSRPLVVPRRSRYYGPMPEGNYGLGDPPPSPWALGAFQWDPVEQERMYEVIERTISSGQIAEEEPFYVAYLHEMIGYFLNEGNPDQVRPRVMPIQQIEFIRLLGRIGSRDTIPFLAEIFNRHHEPAVRAACAEAIGRIGVDPDGLILYSYAFFLSPNNPHRDPQLLLSAARSIVELCRFAGPPLSGDGLFLLRQFHNLSWLPLNVRNFIQQDLDDLFTGGFDQVLQ
ncbi:MAG: PQQ-binding-like beta-propeller repeat protein [Treponema sp.]|nr:PQQ-binding-like beta-propeller repeat protein [Treponema sp.]